MLTQAANGTIQTLTPATVQTVTAPQVQQVPVSKNAERYRDSAEGEIALAGLVSWLARRKVVKLVGLVVLARVTFAQMFLGVREISS